MGDGTDMQPLPCVEQAAGGELLHSTGGSSVLCDDLGGWDEGAEGGSRARGYMYICS